MTDRRSAPALLFLLVILLWVLGAIIVTRLSPNWATRGQIGDMFGAVNALFSGLAFASVGYAIFLQRQELEHMRAARSASVVVDLQFTHLAVYLAVSNIGSSEATNIKLDIDDRIPWSRDGLLQLEVVKTGISYLPPGRTLKFWAGIPIWKELTPENAILKVKLAYTSDGHVAERDFVIDFAQFKGSSAEPDDTSRIVDAIREISRSNRMRSQVGRMFQPKMKACVECAESIKLAARRCRYCTSLQPEDEGG